MYGSGNTRGRYSVNRNTPDKKLFCRWGEAAFVLGTLLIALGVALMEKGGLGMSMVTSQSYIISLAVPFLTFGMADYMLQGLLLIGYYIIVRRFDWRNILSFFSAFVFGVALDGMIWLLRGAHADTMAQRIAFFAAGMLTNSLGVAFFFRTYLPLQVYELFVMGIVERTGWRLHRVKTGFDIGCCLSSIILSLIFFGRLKAIGAGTVVCSLLSGTLIGLYTKLMQKYIDFSPALPGLYAFFAGGAGEKTGSLHT